MYLHFDIILAPYYLVSPSTPPKVFPHRQKHGRSTFIPDVTLSSAAAKGDHPLPSPATAPVVPPRFCAEVSFLGQQVGCGSLLFLPPHGTQASGWKELKSARL